MAEIIETLEKKAGPFPIGIWLVILAGGAALAYMVRKGIGGGSDKSDDGNAIKVLPEQSVSFPQVGNYLTPDQPDSGEKGGTNPIETKPTTPVPAKPPAPGQPPRKKDPGPIYLPKPPSPIGLPQPKKPPTPEPPKKPNPGPPAPPTSTVPGGYPVDCTGVVSQSNSATSFTQVYNDKRKAGLGDRISADIATQTAIQGIADMPGLGLTAIAVYVQNHLNWPIMNTTRRSRGLKALTSDQFAQMELWLNTETARNKGKSLNMQQGEDLWGKFNTPFRCASGAPRGNMGTGSSPIGGPKRTL